MVHRITKASAGSGRLRRQHTIRAALAVAVAFGAVASGGRRAIAQPNCEPQFLGLNGGDALGVTIVDDLAFVANSRAGLMILDVHDPIAPTHLASIATPGSAA